MSTQYVIACEPTLSENSKVRLFYLYCCIRCVIDYAESACLLPRIGKENQVRRSQLRSYIHGLTIRDRGRVITSAISACCPLIAGSALEAADSEISLRLHKNSVAADTHIDTWFNAENLDEAENQIQQVKCR
jgi:hypothetical protein